MKLHYRLTGPAEPPIRSDVILEDAPRDDPTTPEDQAQRKALLRTWNAALWQMYADFERYMPVTRGKKGERR